MAVLLAAVDLGHRFQVDGRARLAATWQRARPDWRLALVLVVGLRIGLGLVAALSVWLDPISASRPRGDWAALVIADGKPWSDLLSSWQRWDALWYQRIAEVGYAAGDNSINFYPLYPLLTRIVSLPLGGQVVWAQLLVSSLAFVVAMVLLYRLVCLETATPGTGDGERSAGASSMATLTVLLIALFPSGFALLAPYTESLFLALTLAACLMARRGQPWAAGLAGFCAALTRTQGIFLALPLAYEYLRQRRAERQRPGPGLLAAGLPLLGWLAFGFYQQFVLGESRSQLEIQQDYWGTQFIPPWEMLAASLGFILGGGDPDRTSLPAVEAFNLLCLLGFSGLTVWMLKRLPLMYALYVAPSLGLLWVRWTVVSPLTATFRYALVLFPCFLLVALLLARRPWLATAWLVLSFFFQVLLLSYWVRWGIVF